MITQSSFRESKNNEHKSMFILSGGQRIPGGLTASPAFNQRINVAATNNTLSVTTTNDSFSLNSGMPRDLEKIEIKRMKNRLAARNCRKRKLIIQEMLQAEAERVKREYTKRIVEHYQLRLAFHKAQGENKRLRQELCLLRSTIMQDKHDSREGKTRMQEDCETLLQKPPPPAA